MSADHTNARSADGPTLVAWLEQRRELPTAWSQTLGEGTARRLQAWKAGSRADFWTVDALLTRLGLHVSMVPDEAWVAAHARGLPLTPRHSTRRVKDVKPRYCERCGDEIPRKQTSVGAYEARTFCSNDCVKLAKGGFRRPGSLVLRRRDAA